MAACIHAVSFTVLTKLTHKYGEHRTGLPSRPPDPTCDIISCGEIPLYGDPPEST